MFKLFFHYGVLYFIGLLEIGLLVISIVIWPNIMV